jgi:hypothetical protein
VIHSWRHDRSQWIHVLDEMVEEHLDRPSRDHGAAACANRSLQLTILRHMTEQSQAFRKKLQFVQKNCARLQKSCNFLADRLKSILR